MDDFLIGSKANWKVFSKHFLYFFSDKIVTGSFDKTAKIWNSFSGVCLNTLWGHTGEIVGVEFNKNSCDLVCTASMVNFCSKIDTSLYWKLSFRTAHLEYFTQKPLRKLIYSKAMKQKWLRQDLTMKEI